MSAEHEFEDQTEAALQDINKKTGRNMPQAVLTAVVLIAIIVACLLIRTDLFVYLIIFFMVLGLWELRVDFATVGLQIPVLALWLCSVVTLLATYYAPRHLLATVLCTMGSLLIVVLAASTKLTMGNRLTVAVASKLDTSSLGSARQPVQPDGHGLGHASLSHVAVSVFTLVYIALLASFLILPETFGGHPVAHAILLIFIPALSDTGGLFAGAWLGKHKLSPRISPKKSVEGLIGSMLFAMAGAFAVFAFTYGDSWASHWWVPIVMGVMVGLVGTFGDLCASMLKRDMGIKDMGHLLKGHGGVLDRVDSILLCAPFMSGLLWALGM
ncbi:phosphatidate cytidylyltransferase [Bifidobacterium aemilianum]|uniref:Phosphatidate cytidylyltransferase n=1 Tax=Bifidobacterium aemilianum TaxID=2493120 RepID=A0A366K8M4_9BIFI|nr:phosphatidate cytidylyltransferase [Bifidobacterium aemilianum]RBP98024.1 phosphatidate cytidylyltransferase [Bifidobacterium aemilianum]